MTLAWSQVGFEEGAPDNNVFLPRIGHIMGSEGHRYPGLSHNGPPSCNLAFLPRIRPQKVHCWPRLSETIWEWLPTQQPDTLQFWRIGTRPPEHPAPARPIITPDPGTGAIVSQETSWRYPLDPLGHNQLFSLHYSL